MANKFEIEEKILDFSVTISEANFNTVNEYFLKLSIQSQEAGDYGGILLQEGGDDDFVVKNEVITDVVPVVNVKEAVNFQDTSATFRLPKGFCKNDKNHDVYLLVLVYILSDDETTGSKNVGEAKFSIYPPPTSSNIDYDTEPGKDLYCFTNVLDILRATSIDNIQMHCGRIKCRFSLREQPKPESPPPSPPTPQPLSPLEEVKEPEETVPKKKSPSPKPPPTLPPPKSRATPVDPVLFPRGLHFPTSPSLASLEPGRQLLESPVPDADLPPHVSASTAAELVARPGYERIDVIAHAAVNVPSANKRHPPQPYFVLTTKSCVDQGEMSLSVSHAMLHATHAPSWEEYLSLEIPEDKASDESLILIVGDKHTHTGVVSYEVPVAYLVPFYHYHLEMVLPVKGIPDGIRTFVSITRMSASLPYDVSSPNFTALEVTLQAVEKTIKSPVGPLIAVARIVPDYYTYRYNALAPHPTLAGIMMTSVTFPSPHPASFTIAPGQYHGYPQLTVPAYPDMQPVWNHTYLFSDRRDKATLFTPTAALVIEYYAANRVMSRDLWHVRGAVGYSTLLLDEQVYQQLISERGSLGMRVKNLPVQGTDLLTQTNETPTVGLQLRLITMENPDSQVSSSDPNSLPILNPLPVEEVSVKREPTNELNNKPVDVSYDKPSKPVFNRESTPSTPDSPAAPSYYIKPQSLRKMIAPIKDGEFPPYDALEGVLPEYNYIFTDTPGGVSHQPPPPAPAPPPSHQYHQPPREPRLEQETQPYTSNKISDDAHASILDYQLRELENYRTAVRKMGQDILSLRQQIRELEATNGQLRRDVAHYDDSRRLILDSTELNDLPKPELADRYASLKQKLSSQTEELKSYKDRVQKLQNEIIKKNDQEKEYLRLTTAHTSQQRLLQRLQEKVQRVQKLEETCRKQEHVIEKMENMVNKHRDKNARNKANLDTDTHDALTEENKRLRQELAGVKDDALKFQHSSPSDDAEKLDLYQSLDRAQGRVMSLEKQLADNSRKWGKDRAEFQRRLKDSQQGFGSLSPAFVAERKSSPRDYSYNGDARRYTKAPAGYRNRVSPKLDPLHSLY